MFSASAAPTRLVGRDREFAQAIKRLEQASDGRGSIVVVRGAAGIGKSHFMRELLKTAREHGHPTVFAENYSQVRTPFGPFVDALRELSGTSKSLFPTVSAERELLSRLLGTSSSTENPSNWDRRRLFVLIQDALVRAATPKGLVVAIDDAQWADPESVELLHFIAGRIANLHLLILLGLRDEGYASEAESIGAVSSLTRFHSTEEMELLPLDEHAVRRLVSEIEGKSGGRQVTRDFIDRVCALADGNPLFVAELVRDVGDNEHMASLPRSLRHLTRKRLAVLEETQLHVVEAAAALGRSFSLGDLASICKSDVGQIIRVLRIARDHQLVDDAGPTGHYTFRHELVRSAVYYEMLAVERVQLHRQIAENAEVNAKDVKDLAMLAYHWRGAGEIERAAMYAELAGDEALQFAAHASARDHFLAAQESENRDEARAARLDAKIGTCYDALGEAPLAAEAFLRGTKAFEILGETDEANRLLLRFAEAAYRCGRVSDAISACTALVNAPISGSLRYAVRASLATFYSNLSDVRSAREQINLAILEECEHSEIHKVRILWASAMLAADLNDVEAFLDNGFKAVELAKSRGTASIKAYTMMNFASLCSRFGRYSAATPALDEAIEIADDGGLTLAAAYARCTRAEIAYFHGDLQRARETILQVEAFKVDAFVVRVHVSSIGLYVLSDLGDEHTLPRFLNEELLDDAFSSGEAVRFAPLAAAHAQSLALRGEERSSRSVIERAVQALKLSPPIDDALCTLARYGDGRQVDIIRSRFVDSTEERRQLPKVLVDGIWHRSKGNATEAKASFLKTEALAQRLQAKLYRAAALEGLGKRADALEVYQSLGALAHVKRLRIRKSGALSKREADVARFVAQGHTNRAIADELGLSERTIENHVAAAFAKLGVRTRIEFLAASGRSSLPDSDVER